jgi:hypothetical protein
MVNLYTGTGGQQRSRPVPPHQRPEELFHALTSGPRRSGYRSPEVSPWEERAYPDRWDRPAQAGTAADDGLPPGDPGSRGRLYSWAKQYVEEGSQTISLEELRPGVDQGCGGKCHSGSAFASLERTCRQRALNVAIAQINAKTDLKIKLASTERSKHRRVVALERKGPQWLDPSAHAQMLLATVA